MNEQMNGKEILRFHVHSGYFPLPSKTRTSGACCDSVWMARKGGRELHHHAGILPNTCPLPKETEGIKQWG